MTNKTGGLSKQRIVDAAIEILDQRGESALTFRALAARLATGSGAIYWHVNNKEDLLATCANAVVDRVLASVVRAAKPRDRIRAIALGVFDAFDAHPWLGGQFTVEPSQTAMLQIFESIGAELLALRVPKRALFVSASALVNYVLGVAGQNAANARLVPPDTDRKKFLAAVAARWTQNDPAEFPFVHKIAAQLRDHDDREQFLAGIDLILAGIAALE